MRAETQTTRRAYASGGLGGEPTRRRKDGKKNEEEEEDDDVIVVRAVGGGETTSYYTSSVDKEDEDEDENEEDGYCVVARARAPTPDHMASPGGVRATVRGGVVAYGGDDRDDSSVVKELVTQFPGMQRGVTTGMGGAGGAAAGTGRRFTKVPVPPGTTPPQVGRPMSGGISHTAIIDPAAEVFEVRVAPPRSKCNPTPLATVTSAQDAATATATAAAGGVDEEGDDDDDDEADGEVANIMRRATDPDFEVCDIMERAATRAAELEDDEEGAAAVDVDAEVSAAAFSSSSRMPQYRSPSRMERHRDIGVYYSRGVKVVPPRPGSGVATELCAREAEEGNMPSPVLLSSSSSQRSPLVGGIHHRHRRGPGPSPLSSATRGGASASNYFSSSFITRRRLDDSPSRFHLAGVGGGGKSPLLLRPSVAHIVD